jgi:hypothetical protein
MDAIGLVAIFALVGELCGYGFKSAQLFIFNDVFMSPFSTKIVLALLGLVVVLLSSKVKIVRLVFIPTIILFVYLLFLITVYILSGKDPYYLIVGFNVYYSMSFLFLVAYQLRGYVSTNLLAVIIACISVPAIGLGMLQFFLHLPFPSPQPDAPINFFSFMRAYSFFGQPAQYSIFLLFIFSLFGSMLLHHQNQGTMHRHSILIFTFIVIIVTAAFTTLTRSLLLAIAVATITLIIINIRFRYKYIVVYSLPFIYLFMIIFVLYYAHDISSLLSGSLTSSRSTSIRYEEWHYYANMLLRSPNVFFMGNGIVQGNQASGALNATIPIDNSFFGVAINIGFIGLVFYLLVFGGMWVFLVNEAKIKSSIAIESALVFFSTCPIYAVIGNILYLYPLCVLIYLIGDRE